MYDDNEFEDQSNEGWIALGILTFIIICGILLFWEPDVERIGTTVHAYLYGA